MHQNLVTETLRIPIKDFFFGRIMKKSRYNAEYYNKNLSHLQKVNRERYWKQRYHIEPDEIERFRKIQQRVKNMERNNP